MVVAAILAGLQAGDREDLTTKIELAEKMPSPGM
jgi:hypothetical protein